MDAWGQVLEHLRGCKSWGAEQLEAGARHAREDLGLTPERFEDICTYANDELLTPFAAVDFAMSLAGV